MAEKSEDQTYGIFPWSLKDRYRKNGKKFSNRDLVVIRNFLGTKTFRVWNSWNHLSKINALIHADDITSSMKTMFIIGRGRNLKCFDPKSEDNALRALFKVSLFSSAEGEKYVKDYTQAWKDHLKGGTRSPMGGSPLCAIYPSLLVGLPNGRSLTKSDLEILAVRCQSRHLPAPSMKVVDGKVAKFLGMVTASPGPTTSKKSLKGLRTAVDCVLKDTRAYCRDLPQDPLRDMKSHCSLSKVGTLEVPLSEGGRAEVMRRDVLSFLEHIPEEDESFDLPWGTAVGVAGIPRWKRFCVHPSSWPDVDQRSDDMREPFDEESVLYSLFYHNELIDYYPRFSGLTPYIGQQILAIAVLTLPLEGRNQVIVRPIPEGGGKMRFITMCRWQVVIIQQAVNHHIVEVLSAHPYMSPIFSRANLGWVTLDRLASFREARGETTPLWGYVSDFSSATDSIHKDAATCVWERIVSTLYEGRPPKLVELGMELLLEPKQILLKRGDAPDPTLLTTRGVFMGEPLTKVTLTLLMLSVFHASQKGLRLYPKAKIPKEFYFAPGDDHMAVGSLEFVKRVSRIPNKWGFILNEDKTSMVPMDGTVHFCEEFFDFRNFNSSPRTRLIKDNTSYHKSMWVDFPKLKLFNPTPLNQRGMRDEGYALRGKAALLGRFIRWASNWTTSEKNNLRRRFIQVCDFLIPKGKLFHTILFPPHMGGLGLGTKDEIREVLEEFSPRFLEILSSCLKNRAIDQALRSVPGVKLHRGFQFPKLMFLEDVVLDLSDTLRSKSLSELVTEHSLECLETNRALKVLRKMGWWSLSELAGKLERCVTMPSILFMREEKAPLHSPAYDKRWLAAYRSCSEALPSKLPKEMSEEDWTSLKEKFMAAVEGKGVVDSLYYIKELDDGEGNPTELATTLGYFSGGADLSLWIDASRPLKVELERPGVDSEYGSDYADSAYPEW
nr:RNA-dependent RNA polymerase [Drosophila-associated narnavirus 4]